MPNAALVRRAFTAFNRRDVEGVIELCHPEIEWRPMRASRAGTVYRGHDGVRQALSDIIDDFEELRNDPRELVQTEGGVVAIGRFVAKERATGVRIDRPAAWLLGIREGRIALMHVYPDGDSALAAARELAASGAG